MENLEQEFRQLLVSAGYLDEATPVDVNESLLESGLIDSLAVIEIVDFIQQKFGFSVPSQDLVPEHFDSLHAISNYLTSQGELGG